MAAVSHAVSRAVRVVVPIAVTLYVVYLVVFLTMPVALQGVAALVVGSWVAGRLLDGVRQHLLHHLT